MAKRKLKQRDIETYNYIKEYFGIHGYAPSLREIGEGIGLYSTSTVSCHVNKLIYMGLLATEHMGCPRAFRVAEGKDE